MPLRPAPFAEPILHLDMDAFFVEVERLSEARLRGKPVAVGGLGRRGVIASASYEARGFGVHSAMPTAYARRLCPELVVVPPHHGTYAEVSRQLFEILEGFTPVVEGLSVDEAYCDVGGLRLHFPSGAEVARAMRLRIREQLGLPSSVGVATSKLVAKIASTHAKPDGLLVVPEREQIEFLHMLPITALPGVGEATRASLEGLGVCTVADVAATPAEVLSRRLGSLLATQLHEHSWGRDERPVVPSRETKSVSAETTYEHDLMTKAAIRRELLRHSDRVAARLRRARLVGATVSIKVRAADFTTTTPSATLHRPTDVSRDIYGAALRLLESLDVSGGVRLVGVAVSTLKSSADPRQLQVDDRWLWLSDAVDDVRARYGRGAVSPAALIDVEGESERVPRTDARSL